MPQTVHSGPCLSVAILFRAEVRGQMQQSREHDARRVTDLSGTSQRRSVVLVNFTGLVVKVNARTFYTR